MVADNEKTMGERLDCTRLLWVAGLIVGEIDEMSSKKVKTAVGGGRSGDACGPGNGSIIVSG